MAKKKAQIQSSNVLFDVQAKAVSASVSTKEKVAKVFPYDISKIGLNACFAKFGCVPKSERDNKI